MDAVAFVATIGGSLVGLAGVCATAWASKEQRESAKELAAAQQAHEHPLASGARLFEKRSDVYEHIGVLHRWMEQVDETEPILRMAGAPEPPAPPGRDDELSLNRQLRTFGSAVAEAYDTLVTSTREFFGLAWSLRQIREQGGAILPWEEVQAAREKVRADLRTIERLVSDEVASL